MQTPRRASWLVAILCAAAVAVTLGATALSERLRPPPRTPTDFFAPLRVAKVDVHQHLASGTVEVAVEVADADGIGLVVNRSGGAAGRGLEEQLAAAAVRPGRVAVSMQLDPEGCCDEAWATREAARVARGKALGASGLAVDARIARRVREDQARRRDVAGDDLPLALDDERLQPIWGACATLDVPVFLDPADPAPSLDALVRVLERYPRVAFVAGPLGDAADDPAVLGRLMDRLPNLWVDLTARWATLGGSAEAARSALLAHPDRVLFGTGTAFVTDGSARGIVLGSGQPILLDRLLGGRERRVFFESAFRILETRDGMLPPAGIEGAPRISGLGLPRRVLDQVYHRNAERLLGLPPVEPRP